MAMEETASRPRASSRNSAKRSSWMTNPDATMRPSTVPERKPVPLPPELQKERPKTAQELRTEKFLWMTYEEFEEERWKAVREEEQKKKAELRRQLTIKEDEERLQTHEWKVLEELKTSVDSRGDREKILAAVKHNGWALRYASDEAICADPEIVLEAVKTAGDVLELASPTLRDDRAIVLAAVRQNGRALRWASDRLRTDKEVVAAAVEQCGWTLQYAPDRIRADQAFWLNPEALSSAIQF